MLPPKVSARVPNMAVALITGEFIKNRTADTAPLVAAVGALTDIPLVGSQQGELIGEVLGELLSLVVTLLDQVAASRGMTGEQMLEEIALSVAGGG